MNMQDNEVANCLSSALSCSIIYIYIDFPFGVRPSLFPPVHGLGAAANSRTNICLSLSADEFLEITRNGITIERLGARRTTGIAPKSRKPLRAQRNLMSGERGRELSAALDTNWSGTISTALFISRLMHYSLLVRTDTYDNVRYT